MFIRDVDDKYAYHSHDSQIIIYSFIYLFNHWIIHYIIMRFWDLSADINAKISWISFLNRQILRKNSYFKLNINMRLQWKNENANF